MCLMFFFFKQKTAYEMRISDWSSDVCSSDLVGLSTQRTLRDALRDLENADEAFIYPSGLTAITGTLLALLSAGDEVLACDTVYNPTRRFLAGTLARYGVTARYFDPADDAEAIRAMKIGRAHV